MLAALLSLVITFPFTADSAPLWEAFCAQQPFITGAAAPKELKPILEAGLWIWPSDALPTAADATQACENFEAWKAWSGA